MWLLDFLRNLLPLRVTLGSSDLIIIEADDDVDVAEEIAYDEDEDDDINNIEGYTNVECCPFGSSGRCQLESEYDSQAMAADAISAVVSEVSDDYVVDALKAASAKVYRGQSCKNCGAWFPA